MKWRPLKRREGWYVESVVIYDKLYSIPITLKNYSPKQDNNSMLYEVSEIEEIESLYITTPNGIKQI